MRRKIFALLLAVLMIAGSLPFTAAAAGTLPTEGDCSEAGDGSIRWKVEGKTLTISGSGKMEYYGPAHAFQGDIDGVGDTFTGNEGMVPWYGHGITKAVIAADVVDLGDGFMGGLFWDNSELESFEVEEGNSRFSVYDDCLYVKEPIVIGFEYDEEAGYDRPVYSETETQLVLLAVPDAKKGALRIQEGTVGAKYYSSYGFINFCKYLTSVEFPSTWGATIGTAPLEECWFDDGAVKMYRLATLSPIASYSVPADHPNTSSANGCLYTKDGKSLVVIPPRPANNTVVIADGTETITANSLQQARLSAGEVLKVTIPRSVTTSEEYFAYFDPTQEYHADFTVEIHGYAGTLAEEIARENHLTFVDLETGAEQKPAFTDVKPGDYFADSVSWAVANNVTSGTSATTFSPNQTCTRKEMVTFLWNAMGKPEPASTNNPFVDVKSTDYFYKAVLWAVENKITAGADATHFNPHGKCTRKEAVTFLWRTAGSSTGSPASSFSDVRYIPANEWYTKAIDWAVANKITSGTSKEKNTFSPEDTCTRAQIVTFLYNAKDLLKK